MGYLVQARDKVSTLIKESPPRWMRPQKREDDPSVRPKVANKMSKLVARGYITEGVILTLTPFSFVTKGTDDIHMVFDATVSGLNDYLRDPKLTFLLIWAVCL